MKTNTKTLTQLFFNDFGLTKDQVKKILIKELETIEELEKKENKKGCSQYEKNTFSCYLTSENAKLEYSHHLSIIDLNKIIKAEIDPDTDVILILDLRKKNLGMNSCVVCFSDNKFNEYNIKLFKSNDFIPVLFRSMIFIAKIFKGETKGCVYCGKDNLWGFLTKPLGVTYVYLS